MLNIEQYISQMKKKDKLDEFNFKNHAKMINEGASVVTVKKSENLLNRWVITGK